MARVLALALRRNRHDVAEALLPPRGSRIVQQDQPLAARHLRLLFDGLQLGREAARLPADAREFLGRDALLFACYGIIER